tara:strand:- start:31 stop:474 length:444 start_codon:yes stop_codon:yes gene_type:complete
MKKNNRKSFKQSANEALIESASQMSGVAVKDLAKGMVGGALMAEAAATQKIRRKAQRKQFLKSLRSKKKRVKIENIEVGPVMSGTRQLTGLPPNKNSTFKMKGFSGFGDGTDVTKEYKKKGNKETKKFIAQGGKVIRKKDGSLIKTK